VPIGGTAVVAIDLHNPSLSAPARVLADLRVYFVKAGGHRRPKVFKLGTAGIPAGGTATFHKRISLAEMTTRRPYPGRHDVEVLLNGVANPVGHFVVLPRR
jgi:hypothetical protein